MTLVEVVVTIAVLSIMFVMVTIVITSSTRFFAHEESNIENQSHLRLLALRIESDIRRSNQSIDENGDCLLIGDVTEYCLDSNEVRRNGILVASNIQDFNWVYDMSVDTITISLVSTSDLRGNSVNYSTRIVLRLSVTRGS